MLYLDLPRPKKFGDSRRRQHLYTPEGGAAGAKRRDGWLVISCFVDRKPKSPDLMWGADLTVTKKGQRRWVDVSWVDMANGRGATDATVTLVDPTLQHAPDPSP